jgi:hypothetical protein
MQMITAAQLRKSMNEAGRPTNAMAVLYGDELNDRETNARRPRVRVG